MGTNKIEILDDDFEPSNCELPRGPIESMGLRADLMKQESRTENCRRMSFAGRSPGFLPDRNGRAGCVAKTRGGQVIRPGCRGALPHAGCENPVRIERGLLIHHFLLSAFAGDEGEEHSSRRYGLSVGGNHSADGTTVRDPEVANLGFATCGYANPCAAEHVDDVPGLLNRVGHEGLDADAVVLAQEFSRIILAANSRGREFSGELVHDLDLSNFAGI